MNELTANGFKSFMGEDSFAQLEEMFNLSDAAFNANYDKFVELYDAVFSSKHYQDQMLSVLKTNPIEDIEGEKEVIEEFKELIKEDDTLSEKKKELLLFILEKSVEATIKISEVPRERISLDVVKMDENVKLPKYNNLTDGGADIYSNETITINGGETKIVHTGLKVATPIGYMLNIYPRSGLSLKTNLRIANNVGIVDPLYRSEIGVIMTNIGTEPITIEKYDRIAQFVLLPVPIIEWNEVKELDETNRGAGFGSSGK